MPLHLRGHVGVIDKLHREEDISPFSIHKFVYKTSPGKTQRQCIPNTVLHVKTPR